MNFLRPHRPTGFTILESVIMLMVLAILTLLLAGVVKTMNEDGEEGGVGGAVMEEAVKSE